ncbi:uncharacterized protein LOC111402390 isoform X2 [Olea europaea var. sylvestris]|uniref:uncharacterized protein LOC111402390 isoform X2 n=1 Tax=Olea europaea var. sylvestris TaxID=158386 RepID=UPI000C1CD170|nr:uncharacterized protein LOC111402390 isoform X2 [Olea europaea var. sylvestris]
MVLGSRLLMSRTLSLASAPATTTTTTLHEIASNHPKGIAKVVLKKGKTQLFRDGSPMVYSGAVDRIIGKPPPKTGDIVLVADGTEKPIGWGLYNSVSMFCVRLMQLEDEAARDPSCTLNVDKLIETRIDAAVTLRERLSGLIVDIFGDEAVVASSAAWVEKYKQKIKDCIGRINNINNVTWRPSTEILKEEGLDFSDSAFVESSNSSRMVKVVENGISYLISLEGQKTGFYADQRENRKLISSISEGQKTLDIFCYTGGFALNAACGGALSATGVDSSLPALEVANENIVLNGLDPGRISFLRQDATEFMKNAITKGESWDIVILDPPKLAPRRKVLQSASGMYRNLNSLAMQITRRGGLLMTCSCSGAMTQSGTFLRVLQGAAQMAEKKITVIRQAGAACDHPIDPSYPEGAYLSNILLRVL